MDVHRTITINAPVDEVFEFWSHFENFPKFMSHVLAVRDLGAGRSHWTVVGPAGTEVHWQAVITEVVPNETLAWKSVAQPTVQHAGIIQFRENADRTTQVDIRLSYNPPAGALGHAVASFFGSDPNSAMDDDLVRLKSLLEEGKATAQGREVVLGDLSDESRREGGGSLATSAAPSQS
ncbi:MAG TPA: SRPBCC family protein [Chloroflexota bacterium]|nr:SRPBCC family protein [Chloroflexota bacterium]